MAEGDKGTQTPKMKPRPIFRIGIFLISHSFFVCVVCCTAGIVALLLLPVLAKSTYISENALMPGSANPMFSVQDVTEADRLVKDMIGLKEKSGEAGNLFTNTGETPRLIAQHMADLGVESYHHMFHPQTNHFHPLDLFSGKSNFGKFTANSSCAVCGINTVGIIRAPRGDGKEAIVLVTPYNPLKIELNEALSVALAYSIISLLTRVTWLAKDIVWLAADSRHGEYASVAAWLRDYHTPAFSDALGELDAGMCPETNSLLEQNVNAATKVRVKDDFSRAGTMAAALVIKVVNGHKETEKDALTIFAEASNGQMPNLDLINIVNYLAVHRQGLRVNVEKVYSLFNSVWLKVVGDILHLVDKVARSINPQWKFAIPLEDYIEGAATLASSMYHQALGLPTGSHGAFRDYQVDAVTLEISSTVSLLNKSARYEFLLRIGRLVEGIIRSVNNLLEKFHQSFFLYFLTSPGKFVSVGVYTIAFALLALPLPIVAAALYSGANGWDSSSDKSNSASTNGLSTVLKSWKWLHAAKVVFIVHLWGAIVSLLPYLICRLHGMTPATSMLSWVSLSICTLLILYQISGSPYSCSSLPQSQHRQWAIMKAVMISAAAIGLVVMSIINFATAQIGALLMVPMCLMAHPVKYVQRLGQLRALTLMVCNLFLGFVGFPPAALLVMRIWSEGINGVSVGDFWIWVESLWAWNSATYLYLGLVHLPCWLLCVHILFHPC